MHEYVCMHVHAFILYVIFIIGIYCSVVYSIGDFACQQIRATYEILVYEI